MKTKLIINADDLGISLDVNKAIEEAIQKQKISSSTIIVNGPAFEDAVRIAKSYPQVSFGVHLNVDEFKPLTDDTTFRKYGITDENGCFKKEVLHTFEHIEEDLIEAIYVEWQAQLNKFFAAGLVPSHVDSHEHTHGIYQLKGILIRLMKENKIVKVRRQPYSTTIEMIIARTVKKPQSVNVTEKSIVPNNNRHSFIYRRFAQIGLYFRHKKWLGLMKSNGAKTTQHFDSYQMFSNIYPKMRKWNKFDTVELMVHPGHKAFLNETNMLMHDIIREILDCELINYNQL